MPAQFAAVWKDSGLLFPPGLPPFLVVPYEGLNLIYLNGVSKLNIPTDLKFDRGNLTVKIVAAADINKVLMTYAENFRGDHRKQVLALAGEMRNLISRGSYLLSVEGSNAGATAMLDYSTRSGQAKIDVVTAKRRTVTVSFRFIRYLDRRNMLTGGTVHGPAEAETMIDVANRLFLPSANIELTLKSATYVNVLAQLGDKIGIANFTKHIVPLRDASADITVFFVGSWVGDQDIGGSAYPTLGSLVLDDAPSAGMAITLSPEKAWPPNQVTDDEIYYAPKRLERPQSDRELYIVLAHEIAHMLGAEHNYEQDNLMSMLRQDMKLSKTSVQSIIGK